MTGSSLYFLYSCIIIIITTTQRENRIGIQDRTYLYFMYSCIIIIITTTQREQERTAGQDVFVLPVFLYHYYHHHHTKRIGEDCRTGRICTSCILASLLSSPPHKENRRELLDRSSLYFLYSCIKINITTTQREQKRNTGQFVFVLPVFLCSCFPVFLFYNYHHHHTKRIKEDYRTCRICTSCIPVS